METKRDRGAKLFKINSSRIVNIEEFKCSNSNFLDIKNIKKLLEKILVMETT